MSIRECASATFNRMLFQRKRAFADNAEKCGNYFKDGCSYPFCDVCNGFSEKSEGTKGKDKEKK